MVGAYRVVDNARPKYTRLACAVRMDDTIDHRLLFSLGQTMRRAKHRATFSSAAKRHLSYAA